jgi:hypothetical protein
LRLLFDNGVPAPLRHFLVRHEVTLARDCGLAESTNGKLISAAEEAGFGGIVTCDKNWGYQQNLLGRRLAIAILPTNIWPHLQPHLFKIVAFIDGLEQAGYRELDLPRPPLVRRPPPTFKR